MRRNRIGQIGLPGHSPTIESRYIFGIDDLLVGGLIAGGGIAGSLIGGNAQAKAAKQQADSNVQAGREQRAFEEGNANDAMYRQLVALYGSGARAKAGNSLSQSQIASLFGLNDSEKASLNSELETLNQKIAALEKAYDARGISKSQKASIAAQADAMRSRRDEISSSIGSTGKFGDPTGPGYLDRIQELVNQFDTETKGLLTSYDADTGTLRDMGDQALNGLNGFGVQRKNAISRDTRRAQAQAAARIGMMTKNSGLSGSSLVPQLVNGAYQRIGEAGADRKAGIDDQLMQLFNTQRNENINRLGGRLGGRTTLQANVLNQSQQLRQQPLQTEFGTLTGGAFNPQYNSGQFFRGNTGLGLQGAAAGAVASSIGSQMFGAGSRALLKALFGGDGGGGGGGGGSNLPYTGRNG